MCVFFSVASWNGKIVWHNGTGKVTTSKTPDPQIRFKLTCFSFSLTLSTVYFRMKNTQRGPQRFPNPLHRWLINCCFCLINSAVFIHRCSCIVYKNDIWIHVLEIPRLVNSSKQHTSKSWTAVEESRGTFRWRDYKSPAAKWCSLCKQCPYGGADNPETARNLNLLKDKAISFIHNGLRALGYRSLLDIKNNFLVTLVFWYFDSPL